ncbi:glyceraldehyde-3-phosphate dehydrogenase [Reichenbachiella sp. 5M10]|uniref:glyceraldehyde-3-phosphate dehydrogenase n=1 Tax=Reichenbachiella sp. 5M10 TaxID=1889772 RepID=UPI000C15CB14|nr:glyceraldehyde-3-phosphate dehydrogenase [Reichenbachiella sp. 5M10]PIB35418.1 glyceraldehyde-3-phosphate dehydrogenase [Reichenbachiella sp. 5M10]
MPFQRLVLVVLFLIVCSTSSFAQSKEKKFALKDSLDGKLDASDFLIDANGFIPMPQIITEPSLGYFGLVFAPIFIHPNKYAKKTDGYVPPNITVGFAGVTANKTWIVGGMRIAHLPQYGLKYRFGTAYTSANVDFYRDVPLVGEKSFSFNFKAIPVFGSLTKKIGNTQWYAGVEYLFLVNEVRPEFDMTDPPDFLEKYDPEHMMSSPGILVEYDGRDNIFTPNTGTLFSNDYRINASWTGSDYNFQNYSFNLQQYFQMNDRWVNAFHLDGKVIWGDAPFYVLPMINMRGVPRSRYQGRQAYLLETEQRYDFTMRWSAVVFGGVAKAFGGTYSFEEAPWVYSYGSGFRYLIARKFGLRMGIDLALSNDDFGYYITFGSAWPKS